MFNVLCLLSQGSEEQKENGHPPGSPTSPRPTSEETSETKRAAGANVFYCRSEDCLELRRAASWFGIGCVSRRRRFTLDATFWRESFQIGS